MPDGEWPGDLDGEEASFNHVARPSRRPNADDIPVENMAGILRTTILRVSCLSAILAVAAACGSGDGANSDEGAMRATLDEFIDAVNERRFDALPGLLDPACLTLDDVATMTETWESFGEYVGDPNYTLAVTKFSVGSRTKDVAQIDMSAVMRTKNGTSSFGQPGDEVIDMMVLVGGDWKISDPECRPK